MSSAAWAGSRSTVSLWRWAPRWARILIAPMRAEPIPQQHHLLTGLKPLRWSSTPIRPVGVIAVVRQRKHSRALVPSGGAESDTHYLCNPRPLVRHPVLDRFLVAFFGLALRPLHAPAQPLVEQPPHQRVRQRHPVRPG